MQKVQKTKSRRRDATPLATIARALAEADGEVDAAVAKRYGVPVGTLRSWRSRAATDPRLLGLLDASRRRVLDTWRTSAALTLEVLLAQMRALAIEGKDVPFSLIAAIKMVGALNVESAALLGEPLEPDAGGRAPGLGGATSEEVRH